MNFREKTKWLRHEILNILAKSKRGHVGGALSCVDILVSLYYGGMLKSGDKFILSKGHVSMALYPILHDKGLISDEVYEECYMNGSPLGGHPDTNIDGIEIDTGSLGHGLGVGVGMALANLHDNKKGIVYVLMGDGECCEGSVWEAAMFATSPKHKLNNIVAIVDNNRISATDFTSNGCMVDSLKEKFTSFGWHTESISGNSCKRIRNTISIWQKERRNHGRPLALIANTIKGRGISYMFNNPEWHHGVPNEEQLTQARREIDGS